MLHHPTIEKLNTLRLPGMARALAQQSESAEIAALSFEERLGLLLDQESTYRDSKRLTTRLRLAALRQNACLEDIDYRAPRGLDKSMMAKLATGDRLRAYLNCLIRAPPVSAKASLPARSPIRPVARG